MAEFVKNERPALHFPSLCSNALAVGNNQVVCNSKCALTGLVLITNGSNNAVLDIFDDAANATGKRLLPSITLPAATRFLVINNPPAMALNGITLNLSGTGANASIYYVKE